jgi:hypothetical protein
MSSHPTDATDVHYEMYKHYFENNEKTYLNIVKEILKDKGENRRKFKKVFQLARIEFLNTSTPRYEDLFNGSSTYSPKSIGIQQSMLKRLGIIDTNGFFVEHFFNEYIRLYDEHDNKKHKFNCVKQDVVINPDVMIDTSFDYDNTLETIRKNPSDIAYHFPKSLQTSAKKLDYSNTNTLQIVKLNHVGGNPRTPIPLTYHYTCSCGNEVELSYEPKDLICDNESCGRKMTRSRFKDVFFAGFASQVIADDFNSLPILSLTPIPIGEFNAAVFLRRNKTGYYMFMIAIDDIVIESSDIKIDSGEHAIWQIIRSIDHMHEDRLGKYLHGMEWYKASILLSYLANSQRYTSMNVLAVGKGGTGKTSVPRFYLSTITQQFKVQDALSLSSPGLYGSTSAIRVGDSVVTIPEAGMLSRYQMAIVDEVYLKGNTILPVLRSLLRASTVSKEVAGNRTVMAKNACVIGTSNPIVEVLVAQSQWQNKWIKNWQLDQVRFGADDTVTVLVKANGHAAMVEEWIKRDLDWHTGQPFPDMDRWMLIFFIEKKDKRLKKHHLNPDDLKIDDLQLSKLFFDQSLHDYFTFCSTIKVDYEKHSDRILDFVDEIRKHDTIHTDRIGQDVALVLTLSAQINGRSELTDEDFDFVKKLWSKTCEWIDVSELGHVSSGQLASSFDGWNIGKIKKEIHTRMDDYKGSPKFYMTPRGFSLISAKLEDMGAPIGLIESTVERYKQNPNQ